MKTLIIILVLFSNNIFAQNAPSNLNKETAKEYLEHLRNITGSAFLCGDLEIFYFANWHLHSNYLWLTREYDFFSKDEIQDIYLLNKSKVKSIIEKPNSNIPLIEELGGCKNIINKIREKGFYSDLSHDETYWDKDINLETKNSYFGIRLKDDLRNYIKLKNDKITNLIPRDYYPMVTPSYEIIPPTPNSLFNKYEIKGYVDEKVSQKISMIVAKNNYLTFNSCRNKQNLILDFYQGKKNTLFVAEAYGYKHLALEELADLPNDKMIGYDVRVWMEYDDNDETVQISCLIDHYNSNDSRKIYDLLMSVFLIEKHKRSTDILKGL
tara:strand:- start:55 stop:1026 length:972 start_codon:yes stop_codon:yes gene_type:complete